MEEERCQCEENLFKTEVIRNLSESVRNLSRVDRDPSSSLLKDTIATVLKKIKRLVGEV